MITTPLLRGVDRVAATRVIDARNNSLPQALRLVPGQIIAAHIDSALPDGTFKVLVAGQPYSMRLPPGYAAGDRLQLTFLSHEPRLTFELKTTIAPGPTLSAGSRFVAQLPSIANPLSLAIPAALTATTAATAITGAPAGDAAGLAKALAVAVEHSGLFYEAHQAQWAAGQRTLGQLKQEPQAAFVRASTLPLDMATGAAQMADRSQPAATGPGIVHPDAAPLVQQQLAVLDGQPLLLQLQAWPGQPMYWAIEEQKSGQTTADAGTSPWTTNLRLELPHLGTLTAALTLNGRQVQVRIGTARADTAELLADAHTSLRDGLESAGLGSAGIAVQCEQRVAP